MARKAVVTKEMILDGAFRLVRKSGFENLTARKLAEEIGCSTQPIFRIYENMAELGDELALKICTFFSEFVLKYPKNEKTPFANLGLAYISFAKKESYLFRALFVDSRAKGVGMYELVNGEEHGFVIQEIKKMDAADADKAGDMFMKIWIFIHGIACMTLTDDFDLDEKETIAMLDNAYKSFL